MWAALQPPPATQLPTCAVASEQAGVCFNTKGFHGSRTGGLPAPMSLGRQGPRLRRPCWLPPPLPGGGPGSESKHWPGRPLPAGMQPSPPAQKSSVLGGGGGAGAGPASAQLHPRVESRCYGAGRPQLEENPQEEGRGPQVPGGGRWAGRAWRGGGWRRAVADSSRTGGLPGRRHGHQTPGLKTTPHSIRRQPLPPFLFPLYKALRLPPALAPPRAPSPSAVSDPFLAAARTPAPSSGPSPRTAAERPGFLSYHSVMLPR